MADAEAVLAVHRATRAVAYAHLAPPDQAMGKATAESWEAAIARSDAWVCERDGRVVGFAAVEDGVLRGLYVLPASQGTGIGTTLHDVAVDHGVRELWVFVDNPAARGFYERRGWLAEPVSARIDPQWAIQAPAMRYRRP